MTSSMESTESHLDRSMVSPRLREMTVVDLDVHICETPGALAPHCAQPWRTALEYLTTQPLDYHGIGGFAPCFDPWPSFPPDTTRRMTADTAAQIRGDMDDLGIDIAVLLPEYLLFHAALRQADYAVEVARAYNRWLVDEWLVDDNGLKGAILAPHHDPVAAAAEIRRYADHRNVSAVYLPTACVEPLYGDRRYDPMYDAAQEAGLPVVLHSALNVHPAFPFNLHGYETAFAAHAISHPFSMMANLASLMETGVPVRFPSLKFAFTEGGITWVPFFMLRLDREYVSARKDVPFLTDKPSTYIRRSMFFATQPLEEPDRIADLAQFISLMEGEDIVVFASDWPHLDFDHPMRAMQIPVPDDQLAKIMGGNGMRLLGLEVPVS